MPNSKSSNDVDTASDRVGVFPWLALPVIAVFVILWIQLRNPEGKKDPERPDAQQSDAEQPGIGNRLPRLQLEPLTGDGRPVGLNDLKGHVTLIDFWGTWCPPCRAELPHLAELAGRFGNQRDFRLLAVSCGGDPNSENVESLRQETAAFLRENNIDLPTYWDPQGSSRFGVDAVAGFKGYPTTVLFDRQGVIRGYWIGYEPGVERQIERRVAELLNAPKAAK